MRQLLISAAIFAFVCTRAFAGAGYGEGELSFGDGVGLYDVFCRGRAAG